MRGPKGPPAPGELLSDSRASTYGPALHLLVIIPIIRAPFKINKFLSFLFAMGTEANVAIYPNTWTGIKNLKLNDNLVTMVSFRFKKKKKKKCNDIGTREDSRESCDSYITNT